MSDLTHAEAMQDLEHFDHGREVELACDSCAECWTVHLADGEDLSYEDTFCPIAGCDGEGEEV
jgi:hypothetical protein